MSQSECREVLEANPRQWVSSYFIHRWLARDGTRINSNTIGGNLKKLAKSWADIEVRLNPKLSPTAKEYRHVPRRTATLK